MSEKENVQYDTYKSVSEELSSLLELAPEEVRETWNTQIADKNTEEDELRRINEIVKDYQDPFIRYEKVKEMALNSEGGKRKEKELENRFIAEYFMGKKDAASYPQVYAALGFSAVIAAIVTLIAVIMFICFKLTFLGIVIVVGVVIFFWYRVSEMKEKLDFINSKREIISQIETKYIVTKDSVKKK